MAKTVTIVVDDIEYEVPAGMNLVDVCKQYAGVDIPVFCYHPKLGHDGNCRMCLVELATPRKNPHTGEMELAWFPTLQTACTQKTSEGMTVRTKSQKVIDGRREILEFLLSSHPLDCPICDKGGECPLQELTLRHGPGTSRMYWEEKMHLGKHVPLGELIYLDQERCILCARCIRFQDNIADDPVLAFDQRGRHQQIITASSPGFNSIFSGDTTDICPVGALTSADFRFNARPWEMVQVATICSHCPVGCNMSFDTRTDREAGGRTTIKRIMPRQNERVNEIWICDKGRFAHHHMEHPERLTKPLIRRNGRLVEAGWEEALREVTAQLQHAGENVAAIAGGRLPNEDLFALQKLIRAQGSHHIDAYPPVRGGEFTASVGVGVGTNLADMGSGDAIVVIAGDLHEEAPLWWLRVKAAAERGAMLITIGGRETRLDKFATHSLRYDYTEEVATLNALLGCMKLTGLPRSVDGLKEAVKGARAFKPDKAIKDAAEALAGANNVIALVGHEGLDGQGSHNLAQAVANLLMATGHFGRPNNGLIVVWPTANGQGASDIGVRPDYRPGYQRIPVPGMGYTDILAALADNTLRALYVVGADPLFDDPAAEQALRSTLGTIIVQDMFLTATAEVADVVLPSQSAAEREGTYTSGERRVQRFYPAIEPCGQSQPDWLIIQTIGKRLGHGNPSPSAAAVLLEIAKTVPQYAGITYQTLAEVEPQIPDVGGEDLYYGGTAFRNRHGLGVQWPAAAESGGALSAHPVEAAESIEPEEDMLLVVPITLLYDAEPVFHKTSLLHGRVPGPDILMHPEDARYLDIADGDVVRLSIDGKDITVVVRFDEQAPEGAALLPRRMQVQGAPMAATFATLVRWDVEALER
ncbi:MAG: NADH-quinone oxidoreductase subunit NuoG [Anaerolineae bacterium]|nr:NADH-quinone oxidoreductase subunit NuoG [Anaerolineae bacterium]